VTREIEVLARHRLGRAREALAEGEHLLSANSPMGAVNRFYYAAFHAARALLAIRQVDSARHSGVIALFQTHFVRSGLFPPEAAKALPRSFEKRQDADYADFSRSTLEDAQRVASDVRAFVDECARLLDGLLAGDDPAS
jgi:uncharacterized protein (UPF0332 family)